MEKIYSKVDSDVLLFVIKRKRDMVREREHLSPEDEFLQASYLKIDSGKCFKAHKHIRNPREIDLTQEAWVIIDGLVSVILYDVDDSVITEKILRPGDCFVTFRGGHEYKCFSDNTIIYEFKNGPYLGVELDKVYIEN